MSKPTTFIKTLLQNAISTRSAWFNRLTGQGTSRDIDKECGHPVDVTIDDYWMAYDRGDMAERVVKIFPEACWVTPPIVYETEDETVTPFEEQLAGLVERFQLWTLLSRGDEISGVGRYGALLLGVRDGKRLNEPIDSVVAASMKPEELPASNGAMMLDYVKVIGENHLRITAVEVDFTSPRFHLPTFYEVKMIDQTTGNSQTYSVHWSRIIHLADNRKNSEVYGKPRLKAVWNRYLDLKKVAGGSAEMFWKGGFPGLSVETLPGLDTNMIEFDEEATKDQLHAYMEGLQRYIATTGMSVKSLSPQIADPRPAVEVQIKLIASTIGAPWRILIGSEAAQLASSQDVEQWNEKVAYRRTTYLTPYVIRITIDRLIAAGVLVRPAKGLYTVEWDDLNTPSAEDEAKVAETRTRAMANYVTSGSNLLVPEFEYLTLFLGLSEAEATSILKNSVGLLAEEDNEGDDLEQDDEDENEQDDEGDNAG